MLKPNNGMGAIKGTSKDMTATANVHPIRYHKDVRTGTVAWLCVPSSLEGTSTTLEKKTQQDTSSIHFSYGISMYPNE